MSSIYEGFKDVLALARKIDNVELVRQILELQSETQALQQSNLGKDGVIQELRQEISTLNEKLQLSVNLVRHGHAYFEHGENGKPTGDPYCSHCYEINHVAVHLIATTKEQRGLTCPACKNVFDFRYISI